jgi:hypothetical protein
VTRGEPRPVHIALIAPCRVHISRQQLLNSYNYTRGYETRPVVESNVLLISLRVPGPGAVSASPSVVRVRVRARRSGR